MYGIFFEIVLAKDFLFKEKCISEEGSPKKSHTQRQYSNKH